MRQRNSSSSQRSQGIGARFPSESITETSRRDTPKGCFVRSREDQAEHSQQVSPLLEKPSLWPLFGCLPEFSAELRIAVVKHVPMLAQTPGLFVNRVAGHLHHPLFGGMPRDPGQAYAPRLKMKKEQHIVGDQTAPRQDFDG
jgi:hypothetical protein